MTSRPSKADLEKAVKNMQLLLGNRSGRSRISDDQKLFDRTKSAVDRVSAVVGFDAWDQIEQEARKRGAIIPIPGQHI